MHLSMKYLIVCDGIVISTNQNKKLKLSPLPLPLFLFFPFSYHAMETRIPTEVTKKTPSYFFNKYLEWSLVRVIESNTSPVMVRM
jgi:hypothetical protein